MLSKNTGKLIAGIAGISTLLTALLIHNNFVQAQNASTNQNRVQKRIFHLKAATLRTPQNMQLFMQSHPTRAVNSTASRKRFRPHINAKKYQELKAAAQREAAGSKPTIRANSQANTTTVGINCAGDSRTDAYPPDTHGAVGNTQFVEVTNDHFSVYNKSACGSPTKKLTLNAFFGYSGNLLFTDPRAVYDSTWKRWVITAFLFNTESESIPTQYEYIAVSTTSDATGSYYIYNFNVNFFNNSNFWDYDRLGMNQDSILITADIFDANNNVTSDVVSIAKARLYNGLDWSVPIFTGLVGGVAPTIVLDQSAATYLVAAPESGTSLKLYKLTNSSNAFNATVTGPDNITVSS